MWLQALTAILTVKSNLENRRKFPWVAKIFDDLAKNGFKPSVKYIEQKNGEIVAFKETLDKKKW